MNVLVVCRLSDVSKVANTILSKKKEYSGRFHDTKQGADMYFMHWEFAFSDTNAARFIRSIRRTKLLKSNDVEVFRL